MASDYEKLKEFWNSNKVEPEKVEGKWIEDEVFNRVVSEGLKGARNVLDYGCGWGWGLFEMHYTSPFEKGIGIDQASNSIDYCNASAALSGIKNLQFLCGDEFLLDGYVDFFDFILSVNTLDVVPDEVLESIMDKLVASLKSGKRFVACLNPEFTDEQLVAIGMEMKGNYGYKNGVFRSNRKKIDEWKTFFSRYLNVVEYNEFYLTENEKKYPPRMMFVLEKA